MHLIKKNICWDTLNDEILYNEATNAPKDIKCGSKVARWEIDRMYVKKIGWHVAP